MNAFTAKTAEQRAGVALELCARSTSGNLSRSFSDCFEMNDGDAVVAAGLVKLARSERYREAVRRCGSGCPTAWVSYVDPSKWSTSAPVAKRIVWASFAGSCYGQEITLHETEREALETCVSALGLDVEWRAADGEEVQPEEDGDSRGRVDELSDDELRDHLDDYCSTRSDDWHVNEVEIP